MTPTSGLVHDMTRTLERPYVVALPFLLGAPNLPTRADYGAFL